MYIQFLSDTEKDKFIETLYGYLYVDGKVNDYNDLINKIENLMTQAQTKGLANLDQIRLQRRQTRTELLNEIAMTPKSSGNRDNILSNINREIQLKRNRLIASTYYTNDNVNSLSENITYEEDLFPTTAIEPGVVREPDTGMNE